LDCAKQRCLVHLLRELAKLREELPWQSVRAFIQPLIDLFRDAIQLGKDREKLDHAAFSEAYQRVRPVNPTFKAARRYAILVRAPA
jgi:hypothetical protein